MLLITASINFGILNKIRVKSKMSRNEKKGPGGKHTRPKKWPGARRPAGPATTALYVNFSVKCLKFTPKWSLSYFQPILAAIFVTIAMVKIESIPDLYTS